MERQYIGARYVPKFFENPSTGDSTWMAGVAYEALTVVTLAGNSYTSKKPVPSGIGAPNENRDYWVSTGIYSEQVESINRRIDALSDNVDEQVDILTNHINDVFYCVYPEMTPEEIQTAINTHTAIKFCPGTYAVYTPIPQGANEYTYGYNIPSNRIVFFDNAIIRKMGDFTHDFDNVIVLKGAENVTLFGNGTIDYNRSAMQMTTSEHGHCMTIADSSDNITVDGLKFINAWGDGIYMNDSSHVYINNIVCDNNRRNGISVISGEHYRITNSFFKNSNGTAPQAGIAIETNSATDNVKDVEFSNCVCSGNAGQFDAYVTIFSSNGSVKFKNIKAENPPPVTLTGDRSIVKIEDSYFNIKNISNVFALSCKDNNEVFFTNCEIDGKSITSNGSFIRYTSTNLHNVFIEKCYVHDLTLTGFAVAALGSREDVNNIIVDCNTDKLNIDTPVDVFNTTVSGAKIIWNLDNADEKTLVPDVYPVFRNYKITANTRLPGTSKMRHAFIIFNHETSNFTIGPNTITSNVGLGNTTPVPAGTYIEMKPYGSRWWNDNAYNT